MKNEQLWMKYAREYIGVHEGRGDLDNPVVVEMYKLSGFAGIKHDSVPWCAAFVGACLAKAKIRPSGSLMARSYQKWGQKCFPPVYGCIGVKSRAGLGAGSSLGHVGFVTNYDEKFVTMISGNTKDMVCEESFRRSEFLAYRYPQGVIPENLPAMSGKIIKFAGTVTES